MKAAVTSTFADMQATRRTDGLEKKSGANPPCAKSVSMSALNLLSHTLAPAKQTPKK